MLSHAGAQAFLRDALTTRQLRIEIWAPEGGGVGRGSTKWTLDKSASPGNLTAVENLLFTNTDLLAAPVIVALRLQVKDNVKSIGVAFADTSMQEMGVSEYVDNELFSNTEVSPRFRPPRRLRAPTPSASSFCLETHGALPVPQSLLIQLGAKECLIVDQDKALEYDLGKIKSLLERCGVVVTERKKSEFSVLCLSGDQSSVARVRGWAAFSSDQASPDPPLSDSAKLILLSSTPCRRVRQYVGRAGSEPPAAGFITSFNPP